MTHEHSGPSASGSGADSSQERSVRGTPVAIGEVLAGKFRVDDVLGYGGMGVVVAATHLSIGTKVAIKFLLPQALASREHVERFAREARIAGRLKSEHVVRIIDVGTLENGAPYLVMEHLEGQDLAKVLKARGALDVQEAVDLVLQTCEGLAEAHAGGIVHRDLKPSNLFLTHRPDGSPLVKVLDFGISKLLAHGRGDGESTITTAAAVIGSPHYMAPEQVRSAPDVDARADVWALGALLYKLLTNKSAFLAPTPPEVYVKILNEPAPPLRAACPRAPEGLGRVVEGCLRKEPNARFADVAQLAAALAPFGSADAPASAERARRVLLGTTAASTPRLPPGSDAPLSEPSALGIGRSATLAGDAPRAGRRGAALWGGAIGVVAVLAVIIALSARSGDKRGDKKGDEKRAAGASSATQPVRPTDVPPPAPVLPDPPPTPPATGAAAPATGTVTAAPKPRTADPRPRSPAQAPPTTAAPATARRPPAYDDSEYGGRK